MKSNFTNKLLLGAAVTALSFGATAAAQANPETLAGNVEWAADADQNGAPADGTGAAAGDAVDLSTFTLTVTNDQTNDDGSGLDTFDLGAVTGTTGDLVITDGDNADLTVTLDSFNTTGTGDFSVTGQDANDADITVTVEGAADIGGALAVVNTETDAANVLALNFDDALIVDGITTLTAGANPGATSNITVDGNSTFTGAVTVTGGAGAGSNAVLNLNGASNTFTGGLNLVTADKSILNITGTEAQTFTGNIIGTGDINVNNAAGVTFDGTLVAAGTDVVIENATGDSAATFTNTVTVDGITLGGAGTGTNTVTFDTTDQAFTVTGAVAGAIAGETNAIVIAGDDVLTQATDWTANIDTINVNGTSTLDSNAALTATTITIADGATLDNGAGDVTATLTNAGTITMTGAGNIIGDIANNGTLQQAATGTGAITGDITGTGALDVDADLAVTGSITQASADIAAATLTQVGTGYNVGTTNFSGNGTLALDDGTQTVAGNFTNTNVGEGTITIADGAGVTTFTGNIGQAANDELNTFALAGGATAQTVVLNGNLFAVDTTLRAGDTLRFAGTTQTVSGEIDGGALGEGLVVVGNGTDSTTVTFGDAIGAGNALQGFSVASGSTANIINNVIVSTAGVSGSINIDGTLNVDTSANNVVLTDANTGIMALDGTLNVTGDNIFTLGSGGTIHAGWNDTAATLNAGSRIELDNDFLVGGPAGADAVGDVYTINAAFRDGNGGTDTGFNAVTGGPVIDAGTNEVIVATGSLLNLGLTGTDTTEFNTLLLDGTESITWITNADAASALEATELAGRIVLVDTAFVNQTVDAAASDAQTLVSTLTLNETTDALGGNDTYAGAADAIIGLPGAERTGELAQARQNLLLAGSTAEANDIAESLSPSVDAGAVVGATTFVNQTTTMTSTRLASLRDGTETGMVAGNISNGLRAWGQVFGVTGDQDERDGVAGYDVDTVGGAVGIDTAAMADGWIVGLGFAYGNTDVDSDGVNDTQTDIDSYQVSLYSSYDVDDRTYFAGQLGYIWSDNEQTRSNVGGIAGLTADSDYDSDVIFANVELGRNYSAGQNTILTPKVMVNYQHYDADGYTETGAGNASLNVGSESLDLLELGVGMDARWDFQQADGSFIQPTVGVGVRHDVIGDEYATTSNFTGGGASFQTEGFDPAQTTFNIGAGVTYYSSTNWDLSAAYNYDIKSDYDAHSGTLRAAYKF